MIFIPLLLLGIFSLSFQPSAAADKIRIGYSGATVSNAMLWVTDEGKLFQKNGIDPQILYLQTTLGQTAMIAGEIDMCVYSGSLLSSARLQGVDVVMVASFLNKPLYRLVVRPEIRTVADLKGKRLGITRFGTVTDSMSRLLVGRLGLDPDKDVSYVQVGDVPVLLASLSTGRIIDGAIIQPPYYLKAVASGMHVLVNMQEMDLPVQQTGLNTTQKFIAKNPDIVRRAVKSVIEGIHLMRTNPAPRQARAVEAHADQRRKGDRRYLPVAEKFYPDQAISALWTVSKPFSKIWRNGFRRRKRQCEGLCRYPVH